MLFTNDLQLLIELYPNLSWNWKDISWNPNMTINMVIEHADEDLNWHQLSMNIPWSDIKKHPELPWVEYMVLRNKTICVDDIINTNVAYWDVLSLNIKTTIDVVLAHLDKPWDWEQFSANSNITPAIVKAHPTLPWKMRGFSANPNWSVHNIDLNGNIDWWCVSYKAKSDILLANPDKKWLWLFASSLVDVTQEILDFHGISWTGVSCNKSLTWELLAANKNKPWDWRNLSRILPLSMTPTLAPSIYPDAPLNYEYLSVNINLTWEMVVANPDKQWDWEQLSMHPNIPYNIIRDYPNLPWQWASVVLNPSITWRIIRDDPNLIHCKIPYNKFAFSEHGRRIRITKHYVQKWRHIIRRNAYRRYQANFIHVLDHLKLYVRDKMAGTLRIKK